MILVLLGTQNNSFHRLLEEIEKLKKQGKINQEIMVQAGYTKYKSDYMQIFDFTSKEDLEKLNEKAEYIITHGGVASIQTAIRRGKKVIAVPRLHEYQEHVNDHQKEIVNLFADKGYIIGISGVEELEQAIEKIPNFIPKTFQRDNHKIISIIEDYIDSIIL